MGGGLGIGPIEEITKLLDDLDEPFQMIVVCGQNEKLYYWFQKKEKTFKKPIFYFGYVNFVNQLMDFADIIITKGGGLTVSEALAKGLATIVVSPIPGQEERNTNYLVERGALIKASVVGEVPTLVVQLLKDKNYLFSLKEKSRQNVIVDCSLRIANLVSKYLA
jgi:processive 1,2-diacylglycerol beta-glucosyltransferase